MFIHATTTSIGRIALNLLKRGQRRRRIQRFQSQLELLEPRQMLTATTAAVAEIGGEGLERLTPGSGDYDVDGQTDYISELHVFSIDDIVGDFQGTSFADDQAIIDVLGLGDVEPITTKEGVTLYPIDSEFGFKVFDFVGAEQKIRDGSYTEGWVGNILDAEDNVLGLSLSDAETGIFKTQLPLGTWLGGLGGTYVKSSTEHYVTMADVLGMDDSPADDLFYRIDLEYNPVDQSFTPGPDHMEEFTASELWTAWQAGEINPNESSVIQDIFLAADPDVGYPTYSVTFKDDGKLLYRWGTAVKKPNDIRLNVSMPLPEAWSATGLTYKVTSANLRINHTITNNPNDQIRPEDLENENAKGRGPSYEVIANPNDPDGFLWVSAVDDYAADGTYLPSYFALDSSGEIILPDISTPHEDVIHDLEGNAIGVKNKVEVELYDGSIIYVDGTIFRDTTLMDPDGLSSDLIGGFTVAWYTTLDRDPFEPNLAYTPELFDTVNNGVETYQVLNQAGPRWRLQSSKFGQDIPGVDIPLTPHSEPPFTNDNLKYEVGLDNTTLINLLDGAGLLDNGVDLRNSMHWIGVIRDGDGNIIDERLARDEFDNPITREEPDGSTSYLTVNGAWLGEGFDFSVYIKGDIKPTNLYDAQLVLEYEIAVSIESLPTGFLRASTWEAEGVTYAWLLDGETILGETGSTFDWLTYADTNGITGEHEITVIVTDSFDNKGSDTITVQGSEIVHEAFDIVGRDPTANLWVGVSNGLDGFDSSVFETWADVEWTDTVVGDFTGDGLDDVASRAPNGEWWVARSVGTSFVSEIWGAWDQSAGWRDVQTADVNADGKADIVGRDATGNWQVAKSDGSTFSHESWGAWDQSAGWQDVHVADVDGDGNDDIVGRNSSGQWWVNVSNGADGFTNELWGWWVPTGWSDVMIADVNGDGRDDIVGRYSSGQWWVALSNGSNGFVNQYWGYWVPTGWSDVMIADVNGDGNDDIVGRYSNGEWWLGLSNGSNSFLNEFWGWWVPTGWSDVMVADVNADGNDDIVGRFEDGSWWVGVSDGAAFQNEFWGVWSDIAWSDVMVGNFSNGVAVPAAVAEDEDPLLNIFA